MLIDYIACCRAKGTRTIFGVKTDYFLSIVLGFSHLKHSN